MKREKPAQMESLEPRKLLAAGLPDPAFGADGIVITNFNHDDRWEVARTVLPMPDGRVLVVGTERSRRYAYPPDNRVALARYRADGSFDATFAGGGATMIRPAGFDAFGALDAALQADGGAVLLGQLAKYDPANPATLLRYMALVRVTPQGALDTAFGNGGIVLADDPALHFYERLLLQPDGRILVEAYRDAPNFSQQAAVVRYNANGTLDLGFGAGGVASIASEFLGWPRGLMLRDNGKIVLAASKGDFARGIATFNPDGTPDTSVGGGAGFVVMPVETWNVQNVALAPDGGYYATAFGPEGWEESVTVVKFKPDATIDTAFGGDGFAELPVAENFRTTETALVVQGDGKIVVSSYTFHNDATGEDREDPVVARFTPGGEVDAAFGAGGFVRLRTELEDVSRFNDVALSPNGIYATGAADERFLLVRLTSDDGSATAGATANLIGSTLTITGSAAADAISIRSITGGAIEVTLNGTRKNFFDDDVERVSITAGGGNDYVDLRDMAPLTTEGVDHPVTLDGGDGNDVLVGSQGRDRITGGAHDDRIHGWSGDDYISGNAQKDRIDGGIGNDLLLGNGGRDFLHGDVGADHLYGGDQPDVLAGGEGNDFLEGQGSHDRLDGGAGLDILFGGGGDDTFFARDGEADKIVGGLAGLDRAQVDDEDDAVAIEEFF